MKPRATTGALMPLAEAVARLTADLVPVPPLEVAAETAIGAVLAADIRAPTDAPAHPIASCDGWAVEAACVSGASPYAPIPLASCPAWVDSGTPLPPNCDTVLSPDAIQTSPPEALSDAAAGDGVIAAGADAREGAVIAAAGTRVTPLIAATVAMVGCGVVAIRRPRLRILAVRDLPSRGGEGRANASGSPLSSGASSPQGGRELSAAASGILGDPLASLLAAYAADWFGCVVETGTTDDLASALVAGTADATFVIGGTGFGRNDRSADILAATGTLAAHGIALRPGDTAGFGSIAERPVLLLPGRPEAALACFLALGRPLMARLAGTADERRTRQTLARKITSTIGLSEIVFVRGGPDGLLPLGSADLPLHRLASVDGAVLVPPDREGYGEGVPVETIPL